MSVTYKPLNIVRNYSAWARNEFVQRGVAGYSEMRALKGRTGKLSWSWVTWHHTSLCGIHPNAEKEEWGIRHLFSLNFLYPLSWIPWRRWGLRQKSMCPCHSALTAWSGSFPGEIQQKAAGEASPVTASWGLTQPMLKRVTEEAESLEGFHTSQRITTKLESLCGDILH